ncbi:MAG: metallophosphoesterase [Salaquimonas sp.]
MKLVHISDIHINPETIDGANSTEQFQLVLNHVEKHHLDADKIVITGDLTHLGKLESYQCLRNMLEASKLKGKLAPTLMIGNHDSRDNFMSVFPEVARDENGFFQSVEQTEEGLFVYLDTKMEGYHAGEYCKPRQEWLRTVMSKAKADDQPVWLFMHHNPVKTYVANADIISLVNEKQFRTILAEYNTTIKHIFFGHTHYSLSGTVNGIPISAPRSTSHPNWPEFSGNPRWAGIGPIARNYNICFLTANDTVIHTIDFEIEDQIQWLDNA